jgi:hypothetical protein
VSIPSRVCVVIAPHMNDRIRGLLLRPCVVALALAMAAGAGAQTASVTSATKPEKPGCVSVGAGVGLSYDIGNTGFASSTLNAYNGESASFTPIGSALVEWALSPAWRLMLGTAGSYTKKLHTSHDDKYASTLESRWSAGAGLGLRWVLNPGQIVEFSPALLLGVHGGRTNGYRGAYSPQLSYDGEPPIPPPVSDSASVGADGRLGFVLEHALLSRLYLRFECYLVRGGVDWHGRRERGEIPKRTKGADAGLGWGLAPSLQLRLVL